MDGIAYVYVSRQQDEMFEQRAGATRREIRDDSG